MSLPTQSHENLVLLIKHFHSLDEYGRERADMLDKAASVAFNCVIIYESDEASYGRYESASLKGGRRVTGRLKDTEHKLTVDLPAEMNDAIHDMMPDDEFQTTLIIEKWDTVYERFGAVAATEESTIRTIDQPKTNALEERPAEDAPSDSSPNETANNQAPAEHAQQPDTNPVDDQSQQSTPAIHNTGREAASIDATSQSSPKLNAEQTSKPTSTPEWEDPTTDVKRTAFDVKQGVGDGFEGDSKKLVKFAVTGLFAIILVGGIIAFLLYSSLKQ